MVTHKLLTTRSSLMALGALCAALVLTSCASDVKKVDFASGATPANEINKVQADLDQGVKTDEDVLDSKDFAQGLDHLNKAKKQLADGADQSKIFDNIGYAKSYLDRAKDVANARRASIDGLLQSRRAAINAGARDMKATKDEFADNDNTIESNIDDLTTNKDVKDYNRLQPSYLNLELAAIKAKNLDQARSYIERAKEEGAESRAPHTYAQAQTSLANAENVITGDRHNQAAVAAASNKAKIDAKLTLDATELTKSKKINESVALDLIKAQDANQQLSQNLKTNEQTYQKSSAEMRDEQKNLKGELAQTESENATLAKQKKLNDSLEAARQQFNADEAESFIQNGKLVIRLKKINFPVAKADLPAGSLASLSKVKDVISKLNSNEIAVEGHTDSTGDEAANKSLSEKRAAAVATYFKSDFKDAKIDSTGYGDSKPLASNKTKAGRAENRRVDVIITPGSDEGSVAGDSKSL